MVWDGAGKWMRCAQVPHPECAWWWMPLGSWDMTRESTQINNKLSNRPASVLKLGRCVMAFACLVIYWGYLISLVRVAFSELLTTCGDKMRPIWEHMEERTNYGRQQKVVRILKLSLPLQISTQKLTQKTCYVVFLFLSFFLLLLTYSFSLPRNSPFCLSKAVMKGWS